MWTSTVRSSTRTLEGHSRCSSCAREKHLVGLPDEKRQQPRLGMAERDLELAERGAFIDRRRATDRRNWSNTPLRKVRSWSIDSTRSTTRLNGTGRRSVSSIG